MSKKFLVLTPEYIKNSYLKKQHAEIVRLLSPAPEFDWDVITELDLSFLNILHIVGLRLVKNLRKLRMVRNSIRKIENLHWLTGIEYLDLSFNAITKIENLENLTALRCLNLCGNRISVLENLDENTLLETFDVSNNSIVDVDQMIYMKRFDCLRSVDVSNNPAAFESVQLIIDHMPKLHYLNGVRITGRTLASVLPVSKDKSTGSEVVGYPDADQTDLLTAMDGPQFIIYLYQNDGGGKLLSKWNSTVRSAFDVYSKEINENAMELYRTILKKLKVRDETSRRFKRNYYKLERKETEESREMIREFEEIQNNRLITLSGNVETDHDRLSVNDSEARFSVGQYSIDTLLSCVERDIETLIDALLIRNIKMNRYILRMINTYENILQEETKIFLDLLVPIFFNLRQAENTYSQILTDNVKLVVKEIHKLIPKMFLNKFKNRYLIGPAAYQITDKHLDIIDKREEKINSDANKWTKNAIGELKNIERKRFWMVIEEVVRYREMYLTQIETLKLA